jgi:excisionase family DNA binding protein
MSLLTAQAVADRLGVPASWVYAEARAGRLPSVRLGRYRRFRAESVDAWIAGLESAPAAAPRRRAPGTRPGGSSH